MLIYTCSELKTFEFWKSRSMLLKLHFFVLKIMIRLFRMVLLNTLEKKTFVESKTVADKSENQRVEIKTVADKSENQRLKSKQLLTNLKTV